MDRDEGSPGELIVPKGIDFLFFTRDNFKVDMSCTTGGPPRWPRI